jgi:hypothetical protein
VLEALLVVGRRVERVIDHQVTVKLSILDKIKDLSEPRFEVRSGFRAWNSQMTFATAKFEMRMPVPQEVCRRD